MPLYKTITVNPTTRVLVWKVEETSEELRNGIELSPWCEKRLSAFKKEANRSQFLGVRHLLKIAGYNCSDLTYDEEGKPHLAGPNYISITHSYNFAGLIISDLPVGIDIEKQRDKILKIANRFTPLSEYRTLANEEAIIRKLTIVWGAKESIYKIMATPGLSFLNHIYIEDFDFDAAKTNGTVEIKYQNFIFEVEFLEFEGFTCVYALSSKPRK